MHDIAGQLRGSKVAVERTHQRVSRSLESLQSLEVSMRKMAWILEKGSLGGR